MSKQHGLWQFHRALNLRRNDVRWYHDELELAYRIVEGVTRSYLGGANVPEEYRKHTRISRCAFRAIRLWKLPQTIGVWNNLCKKIAGRMHANARTLDVCLIERKNQRLKLDFKDEFERHPKPKINAHEAIARAHRIKQIRAERLRLEAEQREIAKKLCFACQKQQGNHYFFWDDLKKLHIDWLRPITSAGYLCDKCYKKLNPLITKFRATQNAKSDINRIRRKFNESTKNPSTAS